MKSLPFPTHCSLNGGAQDRLALADFYQQTLLNDIAPFWLAHGVDRESGGYFTSLDRDGSLLQGDKSVWFLGRMAWMFSNLALEYERRPEWIEAATAGISFMERHAFDCDGRMFFSLTREGLPLRKRRYLFSECFAVIAMAAYSTLMEETSYLRRAEDMLRMILHYKDTPGLLEPKINAQTRPSKGLGLPMILLVTAQELRRFGGDGSLCKEVIRKAIDEVRCFVHDDLQCVLEVVSPEGSLIDTLEGRCINPGHALEAGWFILEESRIQNDDPALKALGQKIIDYSLAQGRDSEYGGILYFRDAKGLPATEYWHDMKFWWPQNEALLATLYAWRATGETRYGEWHDRIARWAFEHFQDPIHGEWYGYLHRDGTVSTPVKGTLYKGFFHLPRMLMLAEQICRGK